MKKLSIKIKSATSSYPIVIDEGIISSWTNLFDVSKYSSIFIITDSNVGPLYLDSVWQAIIQIHPQMKITSYTFEAGEERKNLTTVMQVYEDLIKFKLDRKALIINLGGGVTSDMGGFVASTFQRGVDFLNITTTIEAMVDASVGGKVGVDFSDMKNYIGVFSQPKAVIIDVNVLETLNDREFIAGFAEIIKHGLIWDQKYFDLVGKKHPKDFSKEKLIEIIAKSCEIKAKVVERDERESGLRKILNFGHTIGHALETYSFSTKNRLLHGEAVAIGMVAEAKISQLLGNINEEDLEKIENVIENSDLPISTDIDDIDAINELMKGDKKNSHGKVKWTLLEDIGKALIDVEVGNEIVEESLRYVIND